MSSSHSDVVDSAVSSFFPDWRNINRGRTSEYPVNLVPPEGETQLLVSLFFASFLPFHNSSFSHNSPTFLIIAFMRPSLYHLTPPSYIYLLYVTTVRVNVAQIYCEFFIEMRLPCEGKNLGKQVYTMLLFLYVYILV